MDLKEDNLKNISGGEDIPSHTIGVQREPDKPQPPIPDPEDMFPGQAMDLEFFKSLKCPKCGGTVMFTVVRITEESRIIRCMTCKHEFEC